MPAKCKENIHSVTINCYEFGWMINAQLMCKGEEIAKTPVILVRRTGVFGGNNYQACAKLVRNRPVRRSEISLTQAKGCCLYRRCLLNQGSIADGSGHSQATGCGYFLINGK